MKKEGMLALLGVLIVAVVIILVIITSKKESTVAVQKVGGGNETTSTNSPTQSEAALVLTVTDPSDGLMVGTESVTVNGKTTPGAVLMINDEEVEVSADGSFSHTVGLSEGENVFVVNVSDEWGAEKEVSLTVTYQK